MSKVEPHVAIDKAAIDPQARVFEGLPKSFKMTVTILAIVIATACVTFAFVESRSVGDSLRYDAQNDQSIHAALYESARKDKLSDVYVFVHILNVQSHLKAITNKHALGVTAIACGLALCAIGFALFLIGADGAFQVQAKRGPSTSVSIAGTAPGLFCFAAATALIWVGATREHKLQIGDFKPPIIVDEWVGTSRSQPVTQDTALRAIEAIQDQIEWAAQFREPDEDSDSRAEDMFGESP